MVNIRKTINASVLISNRRLNIIRTHSKIQIMALFMILI